MRILVLDDDADIADALVELLRAKGHSARSAGDGEEGLRLLAKEVPDLIVLDVNMPRMDGREFLAVCRRRLRGAAPRVVVVSANEQPREMRQARFIRKPVEVEALLEAVAEPS